MRAYVGVDVGDNLRVVIVSPERGQLAEVETRLPADPAARADKTAEFLSALLVRLEKSLPECAGVGLAYSPDSALAAETLYGAGLLRPGLAYIAGSRLLWSGPEIGALFPLHGAGARRAWVILDYRPRVYGEDPQEADGTVTAEDRGLEHRFGRLDCHRLTEPVRVMIDRLAVFTGVDELCGTAELAADSAGVRFAVEVSETGYDGTAIRGLRPGIRRPQVAKAALEAVGFNLRYALSRLAGEGAVDEVYAAGALALSDALMRAVAGISGCTMVRSELIHASAYGAAMRAAAADEAELPKPEKKRFQSTLPAAQRDTLYARWLDASRLEG